MMNFNLKPSWINFVFFETRIRVWDVNFRFFPKFCFTSSQYMNNWKYLQNFLCLDALKTLHLRLFTSFHYFMASALRFPPITWGKSFKSTFKASSVWEIFQKFCARAFLRKTKKQLFKDFSKAHEKLFWK